MRLEKLIRQLGLRSDGMANHLAQIGDVGLTQVDVDAGRAFAVQLAQLDGEQEAMKAALKQKTAELNAAQKEAQKWLSRSTKRIKVALEDDKEAWKAFGIDASR